MSSYVLETGDRELERLGFQHEVWGPMTESFLDRLAISRGSRALDLGCGPGFVVDSLARRVGPQGSVVALDESPRWIAHLRSKPLSAGSAPIEIVEQRIEDARLEPGSFDLIFARWVLSFPPRVDAIVRRLSEALAPGGILAVEDYQHEGISLYPESPGFQAAIRGTRALYKSRGGDPFIAGRLPGWMRAAGLEVFDVKPNVLCGGPESPGFRWAGRFFPHYSAMLVAQGLMKPEERERFLDEWSAAEKNPDAMFFSPMVIDIAARKPR
ncbi:MAG TPA: methyltransferase domain-containing protein [Planctomycetota bacterium]|nr:methyltransferase domain-containing protein [Planctomycetota bacterium]